MAGDQDWTPEDVLALVRGKQRERQAGLGAQGVWSAADSVCVVGGLTSQTLLFALPLSTPHGKKVTGQG